MKFSFEAEIYKIGINPCVNVPALVAQKLKASKGYIRITGKINSFRFKQTLVPVKNAYYRLYVNRLMLKGSASKAGDIVTFQIEPDTTTKAANVSILKALEKALKENNLQIQFRRVVASRQKEILMYLNHLKTEDALLRNIAKVIQQLKKKK